MTINRVNLVEKYNPQEFKLYDLVVSSTGAKYIIVRFGKNERQCHAVNCDRKYDSVSNIISLLTTRHLRFIKHLEV